MTLEGARIEVRVLGIVSVSVGSHEISLSPVERHLVALLAAARSDGLDADRLANQLWPSTLPSTWKASLRNNISRLNKKVASAHPDGDRLVSKRKVNRRLVVDDDAVDLWRLLDLAENLEQIEVGSIVKEWGLLVDQPFPNCEMSTQLSDMDAKIRGARLDIIGELAERGEQLPRQFLAELRTLAADNPFNEEQLESVVRLNLAGGEHEQVVKLLTTVKSEVPLQTKLAETLERLRDRQSPSLVPPTVPRSSGQRTSPTLKRLTEGPLVGRTGQIDDLIELAKEASVPGVLIHGEAGIGKTRLAVELAQRLGESGYHTIYLVADKQGFGSLQPFLDAIPELESSVGPLLSRLHDSNAQAQCRQLVIEKLNALYPGRPVCLVADDLHWLDDQSSGLLTSLCRAGFGQRLFVVAVGRSTERTARWEGWLSELKRTGLQTFRIQPLDESAMLEIVRARFDGISPFAAIPLANQLFDLSAGIAEVADWLLERVTPATLEIGSAGIDGTGYDAIVGSLSPELQRCGAIGSILGRRFDINDLCRLSGLGFDEADQALNDLCEAGLLHELTTPGHFEVAHVLAMEALSGTLSAQEQLRYHALAFELFSDPFRRASHAKEAAARLGSTTAVGALLDAADRHFTSGGYRAAAEAVLDALRIDPALVPLAGEAIRLEALERSGVEVRAERSSLVGRAIDAGEWSVALTAAISGLPDAEAFEGDQARVRVLQRIPPERLSVDERIQLHCHLCRQLILVGKPVEAEEQADLAAGLATTPDQRAEAWFAHRLVQGIGRPVPADVAWPEPEEISSELLRVRIRQAKVVDAIVKGGSNSDFGAISDHADGVSPERLPQLHWFSQMFLATALTDQGRRDEAETIATAAHQHGLRSGLRVAPGTYRTQQFSWALHAGNHGAIYPFVAAGPPADFTANIIFDAGVTACHLAYARDNDDEDELTRALERVEPVCYRAMRSPFETAAIGIMVDAIAATANDKLLGWATGRLEPMNEVFVLVASAAVNLGPASGLLAKLQTDERLAADLGAQAIELADAHQLPLWQVSTRLDKARSLPPDDPESTRLVYEARQRASTPWLEQLIADRLKRSRLDD